MVSGRARWIAGRDKDIVKIGLIPAADSRKRTALLRTWMEET